MQQEDESVHLLKINRSVSDIFKTAHLLQKMTKKKNNLKRMLNPTTRLLMLMHRTGATDALLSYRCAKHPGVFIVCARDSAHVLVGGQYPWAGRCHGNLTASHSFFFFDFPLNSRPMADKSTGKFGSPNARARVRRPVFCTSLMDIRRAVYSPSPTRSRGGDAPFRTWHGC